MVLGRLLSTDASHATSFDDKGVELREYYAAACGHCQALAPAWKAAQAAYAGPVTFRQIECNDENWKPIAENEALCKDIDGFPTIKLFKDGQEVSNYSGDRSSEDIVKFAKEHEKLVEQTMPASLCFLPMAKPLQRRSERMAAAAAFL
mmetsp:Transcript_87236/g.154536  ORF Transcript_87236/g.154536 Transcript_87236/m.154536 type:complete len:148 (-) Transcript_87236:64-507(-)